MDRRPLQSALREMHAVTVSRYSRIGLLLATILLTVSGPFGTFERFNVGQRLAYWAIMVVVSYLVGQGATAFFIELLRERVTQKWPRALMAGVLAALPVTLVVLLVEGIANQHLDMGQGLTLWLYVTIITLVLVVALVAVRDLVAETEAKVPAEAAPVAAAPEPPPILTRVPLPQRGALLALIVEDHYVDIVTDKGKTLVLMRLADAIRETGVVPGLQIHRSHWVAKDAVAKVHRGDGKVTLELRNGMRLAVSRSYLAAAREAGLA